MSTPVQAVLFDAAGTLLRLREPVGDTYARLARTFGVNTTANRIEPAFRAAWQQMPPMLFPSASPERIIELERAWWRKVVATTFRIADESAEFSDFEQYFNLLFAHFAQPSSWQVIPDAVEVLAALRGRGLRTGIVSNFDHRLKSILDGLGLRALLDVLVLPADAGALKPDARIFRVALSQLDVVESEAAYVGDDAEHDIAGARAAGLRAIDVATLKPFTALLHTLGVAARG
ncbi:MAG: HAD-IA family hydrolase [Deltaproteobacteria bacterium]|nr:HAD-IA family hydrolase [Deltaproteobacteria bacterium]MBI3386189.1 HAD-IA family hydrolase [Deltaproteobacteria bacterium]